MFPMCKLIPSISGREAAEIRQRARQLGVPMLREACRSALSG